MSKPTDDDRRHFASAFDNVLKAREAIDASLPRWRRGAPDQAGTIDCPVCGQLNSLHFCRAGRNGHIHAQCGTDGCVQWME